MTNEVQKYNNIAFQKDENIGPTEIWTRIAGFRVQSANHYTIGPCCLVGLQLENRLWVSILTKCVGEENKTIASLFSIQTLQFWSKTNKKMTQIMSRQWQWENTIEFWLILTFSEHYSSIPSPCGEFFLTWRVHILWQIFTVLSFFKKNKLSKVLEILYIDPIMFRVFDGA